MTDVPDRASRLLQEVAETHHRVFRLVEACYAQRILDHFCAAEG